MHSTFPVHEFHTCYIQKIRCGLKMLLLFSFWIITGFMAEGLAVIYRLKNSSVCLNGSNSPSYKSPKWAFDKEIIVEGNEINPNYTGKVVYNPGNLSLCINNLTDTDTGIYEFSFSFNFRPVSKKHQLIVQEMVPRPVIMMSDRGSNRSAGVCSIMVNCSIQDEWLSSVCGEDNCKTSQKAFSKVNITIFSNNRTVTCSGSNHVSTNNASETIMACFSELNTENKEKPQQHLPTAAFIIAVICVLVLVLILVFLVKRQVSKKCKSYQQRTSTVHSIQSQPMETLPPSQPRVSTGSSSSDGDPAYENADIIQLSQTSSPAARPREEMSSMDRNKVDTIYSFPDGNASSANNTQNTSEAATVEEAQRPTQIDTVYSVLQKPKNLKPQRHQEVKQDL